MIGSFCIHIYGIYSQCSHIFEICLFKLSGNQIPADAVFFGPQNYFIVYVGDILKICELMALASQVFGENIEKNKRSGVADMRIVVDCRTADKKLQSSPDWLFERFFLTG